MNVKEIKEKFKAYEESKLAFKNSHKPATCCECGCKIYAGSDIVVIPETNKIFCSAECLASNVGASTLLYNVGDSDYESWFDKLDKDDGPMTQEEMCALQNGYI